MALRRPQFHSYPVPQEDLTSLEKRLELTSTPSPVRRDEVDCLRGMAVILMVIFHIIFDLKTFGVGQIAKAAQLHPLFWSIFPRLSSVLFLTLVGVSASLGTQLYPDTGRSFIKRSGKILAYAALVSAVSFAAGPKTHIYFGILHCIGVSLILIVPFLKLHYWNLGLGAALIAITPWIQQWETSTPWMLWLGFRPVGIKMVDHFPLIPFFGVILIGLFIGGQVYGKWRFQLIHNKRAYAAIEGKTGRFLQALGRKSLLIYLGHQPVILALLWVLGLIRLS